MTEIGRKSDRKLSAGGVQLMLASGKPIAQVVRELSVHECTLGI